MKYLLTFLLFVSFSAYAQEPAYTPMRLSYQFRGIKVDSLFLVPSFNDTIAANNSTMKNVAGSMIRTGNDFWMRNAATTAWLQNVNVGSGASPAIQFVDSIYRVAGKDSIFWRKGGVVSKIKDSTVTNSPDRINGTASGNVISAFGNNRFGLNSISKLTIQADTAEYTHNTYSLVSGSGYEVYGNNMALGKSGTFFTIENYPNILFSLDSSGNFIINATDSIYLNGTTKINTTNRVKLGDLSTTDTKGDVLANHAVKDLDLSSVQLQLNFPGVYSISTASATNKLSFPNAGDFPGQMIIVINKANATTQNIDGGVDTDGNDLDVTADSIGTYFSDGDFWYGYIN